MGAIFSPLRGLSPIHLWAGQILYISRMNEINECFVFSSCQAPCALANKMLTTFNGQEFVVVVVIGWLKGIISDFLFFSSSFIFQSGVLCTKLDMYAFITNTIVCVCVSLSAFIWWKSKHLSISMPSLGLHEYTCMLKYDLLKFTTN